MDFYQNLLGSKVMSHRHTLTIVAAWRFNNGVRVLGVGADGETFLVDLPDTGYDLILKA
jgi:hypothetical protein